MSAYWFGIISSTVFGRFRMIGSPAVAPHVSKNRLANFQREIDLGGRETFRRILEADFRPRNVFHAFVDLLRPAHGDV